MNRAPKRQELAKMERSPPSVKKQMTDEQLARFLQEQEELLSNRDENVVPQNVQSSNSKFCMLFEPYQPNSM